MRSVDEVWDEIDRLVTPLDGEWIPLNQALGRLLREPVISPENLPAFHRSAMDGFLVVLSEKCGSRLSIVAGALAPEPGIAIRIATGGAVPDGHFGVIRLEDVTENAGFIVLNIEPDTRHIRPAGSHLRTGDLIFAAGEQLNPASIGLLASLGITRVCVAPMVSAVHITTGSEIVTAGSIPRPGTVRDANGPLIAALLTACGGNRIRRVHVSEDCAELVAQLDDLPELLVISGGASVGARDHTRAALEQAGFDVLVAGVNVRPGKPLILARRGKTVAFGLPGNPLSHFVCFHLFVRRFLARLRGEQPAQLIGVRLRDPLRVRRDARVTWWPAYRTVSKEGITAEALAWLDSSDLRHLHRANGLLRIPAASETHQGDVFPFMPL